ncbi:PPC domain-containing protein [Wenzhouxiangella marina]|uniref:Peptidase C-terminal archaeal/bacterial domain-containing protein n=1 Tax=Wenzhouxiangella marina TaxID=1579979 RepID=A0A0K0XS08_9GAMM|nr:PPC domain-containing protein [Wenzhouxiangella marina]AKS40440.1 hypothetical protein WM2015_49 [Wenzhouxiangella marina]MBB6088238.1 hypothetical protein [Wenzhouxiangella marina]
MIRSSLAVAALLAASSLSAQEEIYSAEGSFVAGGDPSANRHVIPVEAGMSIEVIVYGDNIDTTVNATLPDGETLYNDDYEGLDAGFTRTMTSGGALEIVAAPLSSGTTGTYRVVVRTLPPPESIEVGDVVNGRLSDGGGMRYELSGQAGDRIVIDLKSYDFDAYLTLTEANGNELTDDDGGDEGYNSRLHYMFKGDETITITASSLGSDSGRFELSVSALSNDVAASISGRLTADSPRGYDGTRYERHEIEGEAGETLTIMLDSDEFDPVLYVSNPDGSNLIRDDDGGENNNSLAVVSLVEDGVYAIYVTSFSESQGAYTLTIYR